MAQIIEFKIQQTNTIDISALRNSARQLRSGLIESAVEDTSYEIANEHTSEPIKDMDEIFRISNYLISQKRFRDNMLFIVGINFGLRVSDLRLLRFSHLINENFAFKDTFPILEQKTKNTRKQRKNRYITINTAVVESVTLYLENTPGLCLSDYMFRSERSIRCGKNDPLHRSSIDDILKDLARELSLSNKMSTHSLRKTFAYHQMVMSHNDPRKLLLLQKIMGHSSVAQTLDYIGITNEEIEDAYRKLNLGSVSSNYLVDGSICEESLLMA